jgi:hypothetical protein
MRKIVLTFGLIASAILASMMAVSVPLHLQGKISTGNAEILGYSSMVLAFLMVFVGIRTYREKIGGGTITFGRAFKVGILITLVTATVYVVTWEIIYYNFLPDFGEKYAAMSLAELRAGGASAAEMATATQKMDAFQKLYANPFINIGMTFMEIFPVGLLVTLISAAILRRKTAPQVLATAT